MEEIVMDVEEVANWISEKIHIDKEIVLKVLDSESDWMEQAGII